jgi:hypothetical protein
MLGMNITEFIKSINLNRNEKENLLIRVYDEDEELIKLVKTIARKDNIIIINCSRF